MTPPVSTARGPPECVCACVCLFAFPFVWICVYLRAQITRRSHLAWQHESAPAPPTHSFCLGGMLDPHTRFVSSPFCTHQSPSCNIAHVTLRQARCELPAGLTDASRRRFFPSIMEKTSFSVFLLFCVV